MAKQYPYTKEELVEFLLKKRDELGKTPTKKDIPEQMRPYYRVYFGKWCYALEETGIVVPSEDAGATCKKEREVRQAAQDDACEEESEES